MLKEKTPAFPIQKNKLVKKIRLSYCWYLFLSFSTFILIITSVFFILLYHRDVDDVRRNRKQQMRIYADSAYNSLVNEMDVLSTISMNIVYSNAVRDSFKQFVKAADAADENKYKMADARKLAWNLSDYVFITFGAFQKVREVNIYSLDGLKVCIGNGVQTARVDLRQYSWYTEAMKQGGKRYVTAPARGSLKDEYTISLIRLFYDEKGLPEGFVEVVQDCGRLFRGFDDLAENDRYLHIVMDDDAGRVFFPYKKNSAAEPSAGSTDNSLSEHRYLEKYGWNIYLTEESSVIADRIKTIKYYYIALLAVGLTDMFLVCFAISNSVTTSINKLTGSIRNFELKDAFEGRKEQEYESNIKEIDLLWQTYKAMQEKLSLSAKELLLLKSEEMKNKLRLSQAFIEPHFLYNVLDNISVMADENMNGEIERMCSLLVSYLRCISSTADLPVTIQKEIETTRNYLDIMMIRYGREAFSYEISCPDTIPEIMIPRFVLQPMAENVFKHAFTGSPPWKLRIAAGYDGVCWKLSVTDNGGSFSEEKKDRIMKLFADLNIDRELDDMHIGGSGLKNTYIRLKMRYKENTVFIIDTSKKGYTTVTIGGSADDADKDKNSCC